jgi:hypothetical protein
VKLPWNFNGCLKLLKSYNCFEQIKYEKSKFNNYSIIVKKKVKISGHLYGSTDKNNKHRDDCFVTKDGKFAGLIKYVMEKYHSIYFISVKLDYEQPFCSDFQPFLKSDISLARKSNEVLILRSNDIK